MVSASNAEELGLSLVHAVIPGRVRLHVPGLRGATRLKLALERSLAGTDRILSASGSVATGNILVICERGVDPTVIFDAVAHILARYRSGRLDVSGPRSPADDWHLMSAHEVLERFDSSRSGLSSTALRDRLRRYGENVLPSIPSRGRAEMLLEQFKSLPVALLLGAAMLSLLTGGMADAIVILSVIALNAGIGYLTESHAERAIRALSTSRFDPATVVREGRPQKIAVENIVPGDLLDLRAGMIVAADARVVYAQGLSVNEATLTGESAPVQKSPEPLIQIELALADRSNMVHRGAIVTGGSGLGIVVATGAATEIGHVQDLIGAASPPETPLQQQLGRLGRQLTWVAGGACAMVLLIGVLRRYNMLGTLKSSIALAVAAVPEGLPTLATTTLALGIERMRRRKVLVRRLEAVETLASIRVACLDKTGTLTLNRMAVAEVSCGGEAFRVVEGKIFDRDDRSIRLKAAPVLERLAEIVSLCNETVTSHDDIELDLAGSATETALLRFALALGLDVQDLRRRLPLVDVTYRTEGQLFMATLHAANGDRRLAAVKGSPEAVLSICNSIQLGNERIPLTAELRGKVERENIRLASAGQRVLGVAYAYLENGSVHLENESARFLLSDMTWTGLIGLADPVRPGVTELLSSLRKAGISPIMITGDQKNTAVAIARQLHLGDRAPRVMDSSELAHFSVVSELSLIPDVFSRVTPRQKLEIVQGLQRAGLVVAMTGDGVNDSPALKAADVGIAIGRSGSEAVREVADIVLEDDDLAALIPAIELGRTTYANIRRAIRYLLATNLSEILLVLCAAAAGLGQPLTPAQLLWINLITDVLPALALGVEPSHHDRMRAAPRNPREDIIGSSDYPTLGREAALISAGAFSAYIYGLYRYGFSNRARTVCFSSLIIAQLLHSLSCRSRRRWLFSGDLRPNPALTAVLALSFALQFAAMTLGPVRNLLGVVPLGLVDLAVAFGTALAPFMANEILKPVRGMVVAEDEDRSSSPNPN
jgi:P-type Ca2+ transporter type 2C